MATTKKSVKKSTVKKAVVKKEICKCGCASGCKCTCQNCKCENCNCGCKKDSVKYTNMFAAFRAFWRRGFTEWAGTSSRSEFWLSWLCNMIIFVFGLLAVEIAFELESMFLGHSEAFSVAFSLALLIYIALWIIPAISMLTRRMHDAGLSAWFWLLYPCSFISWLGSFIWCVTGLVIVLLPTKKIDNPYHKFNK